MSPSASEDSARLCVCAVLGFLMAPGLALLHDRAGSRKDTHAAVVVSIATIPLLAVPWAFFGHARLCGAVGGVTTALQESSSWAGHVASHGLGSVLGSWALGLSGLVAACAIMVAAFAGRLPLRAHVTLLLLWSCLVYAPVAHWVWASDGWLARFGVLDFGGGGPIHLAAGTSSLVCAAFVQNEPGDRRAAVRRPRSIGLVIGAVLLSVGCLGWMGGASWAGRGDGARTLIATCSGAVGGGLGWLVGEAGRESGQASGPGVSSGVMVGLAGIAAAGGYVSPGAALVIGIIGGGCYSGTASGLALAAVAGSIAIVDGGGHVAASIAVALAVVAGFVCYASALARRRLGRTLSFSSSGVHALGGATGILLTGILANGVDGSGVRGALFGNVHQFSAQFVCCAAVATYAAALTLGILAVLNATIGLRRLEGAALLEIASPGREACVDEASGHELHTE